MPNVVKFSGGRTPAIPGPAEKTVPTGSSSSLSRGIDSSLSGLMDCHPSKPTQDSSETLVASAPPRRTLAKLERQERPSNTTANFLNAPRPPSGAPPILKRHELSIPARTRPGKNQAITNPIAARLGTQDWDGTFVANGNWNDYIDTRSCRKRIGADDVSDELEGHRSAFPSRTDPLEQHEAQLAGYQLGAKLNGDAIDNPDDRRRLALANETVHDTRIELRHGRGNVLQDIEATGRESMYRTAMSFLIGKACGPDAEAGAALAYGAGNCDQNGKINSRSYIPCLFPGETTHTVAINAENMALSGVPSAHTFSELYAPPRESWKRQANAAPQKVGENSPPIVMDSWANGPAVRRQDSIFAPHAGAIECRESFELPSYAHVFMQLEKAKYLPGGRLRDQSERILRAKRAEIDKFPVLDDIQVVNPQFAQQAAQNLSNTGRLSSDIMTVGAGREAYNLSVSEATKPSTLDSIRYETANLNNQARPLVLRPEDLNFP